MSVLVFESMKIENSGLVCRYSYGLRAVCLFS